MTAGTDGRDDGPRPAGDEPPICPACGVTMVPGALSAHGPRDGWVCLECEETGEPA